MPSSNGKSSIVEERLYSFSFALFQKNEASFFVRFLSSSQSLRKMFVLLRSCTILEGFASFCFIFEICWNTPIRFTFDFESVGLIPFASFRCSKILEQHGRFRFVVDKVRTKFRFVSSW